ncbi:MAG: endonuclease/exonuclease/phosphatase family protein [Oscillospiraceae bacterium]|nr:endonuclease/exonuclease/phosphatase family protein [Oscillospiraceae bacterium]
MKTTKRTLALCTGLLLCLACFALPISAADALPAQGELKMITYNIDGLPLPAFINGYGHYPWRDAAEIGRQIAADGCALLAVQEDFSNYFSIRRAFAAPYYSYNQGNIPAGDGLDFFSQHPIYNIERRAWAQRYGGFTYGATDEYTPKGFQHAVMELAPGVYLDVYNLHANAGGGGAGNPAAAARRAQFQQLSAYMQEHSQGRAVVVLGDFNTRLRQPFDGLYEVLMEPNGLRDTWAETFNDGREAYTGQSDWYQESGVDRIMYRSGDAVALTLVTSCHQPWRTAEGRDLSDHAFSWAATFAYAFTGVTEEGVELGAPKPMPVLEKAWGYIYHFFRDLGILFTKDLPNLLGV